MLGRRGTPWLLLVVFAGLSASVLAADTCGAPYKTLSSDCRGAAADGKIVCLVVDQSAGQPSPCKTRAVANKKECAAQSGRSCDVLSYKIDYQSTKARFRIKFQGDNWVASAEDVPVAAPAPAPTTAAPVPMGMHGARPIRVDPTSSDGSGSTGQPDSGGPNAPYEGNEFIDSIGQLRLDSALTEVRIVGGSSEFGTRGAAAKLQVDPHMLLQSPQVTSLWIANCNIGDQLSTGNLLSGMPTGLTALNLRNTLMRAEPSDLSVLQNLRSLKMEQNYLTTLSSKVSLRKLTSLDLTENNLKSFDAFLPAMESLYLNKNKLDAIPSIVYSMSKLQELQLAGNPIAGIVVSATQFNFLNKLRLMIDKQQQSPPAPVVYVPGPLEGPLPPDITNLVLSSKNADLTNAVAVQVGSLVDLQGVSVWKIPDAIFEVFTAQQDAIAKSSLVIGGKKVQSYKEAASSAAGFVFTGPTGDDLGPNAGTANGTSGGNGTAGTENGSTTGDAFSGGETSTANGLRSTGGGKNGTSNSGASTPASEVNAASSDKAHKSVTLSITLVAIGVVAVVLAGIAFVRHRRRSTADDDSAFDVTTPNQPGPLACYKESESGSTDTSRSAESFRGPDEEVRDLFSSRRIRTKDLEDVRPIGAGATGVVWLVKWRGSRLLASKRLIQTASTSERMNKFVNEVVIAADLDYPHIVRLIGVSWTNETDLQALYEYMPNGDLQTYLHNHTSPDALPWSPEKLQMAIDIVEALVYTHSFNPPLVHRDLRTRNVLLDEHMRPKLTNFGSARFASEQNTMTTDGVGSARWLAPEILNGSTDYDHSSDMYALGVLLCELDSHSSPYEGARDARGELLSETALMELVMRGELRLTLSAACPPVIQSLVSECLSHEPLSRPTAMRAAYELRGLKRQWDEAAGSDKLAMPNHGVGEL